VLTKVNLSEIVGKTVAGISDVTTVFVVSFTDGTYAAVCVDEDSYFGPELDEEFYPRVDYDVALKAGVITAEERDKLHAQALELRAHGERADYERLKAKFEGKP
jgi:hypothetical protein